MAIGVPNSIRTAAKRVLPASFVERLRATTLRRYYVESLISKESRGARRVRCMFTHKKPVLFHLDVHITDHCNLNCRGCEHYSSISEPVFADLAATTRELERMAELFDNIEQMYLLGGEPLLHPEVEEFVRVARRVFPRTRLSLMTNGVLVARMPESFWKTLHDTNTTLLCDSYPINIPVDKINGLGREHGVRVEWMKPASEFFKIPLDVTGSCDPSDSFDRCRGLSNCAIVRDGRLYPCAHIAYVDILQKRFDVEGIEPGENDSISIWEGADGDEIIDFLMKPVPWCSHCDFDAFEKYPWSRGTGDPDEWLKTPGKVDSE